jgi:hypothetical protein
MEYPAETIVEGAKGKREARILRAAGLDYIVYGYFDIGAEKMLGKYSILLRRSSGATEHLLLVPAGGGRELVVKHEIEEKPAVRVIFDERKQKVVRF